MKIIISLLLLINTCFAADIVPIKKGQAAPFSGFVISYDMEKSMRQTAEDSKVKNEWLDLASLKITIIEKRNILYKNHNEYLSKEVYKARKSTFWTKTIYFIGGIAVTGAIGYLAVRAVK